MKKKNQNKTYRVRGSERRDETHRKEKGGTLSLKSFVWEGIGEQSLFLWDSEGEGNSTECLICLSEQAGFHPSTQLLSLDWSNWTIEIYIKATSGAPTHDMTTQTEKSHQMQRKTPGKSSSKEWSILKGKIFLMLRMGNVINHSGC